MQFNLARGLTGVGVEGLHGAISRADGEAIAGRGEVECQNRFASAEDHAFEPAGLDRDEVDRNAGLAVAERPPTDRE